VIPDRGSSAGGNIRAFRATTPFSMPGEGTKLWGGWHRWKREKENSINRTPPAGKWGGAVAQQGYGRGGEPGFPDIRAIAGVSGRGGRKIRGGLPPPDGGLGIFQGDPRGVFPLLRDFELGRCWSPGDIRVVLIGYSDVGLEQATSLRGDEGGTWKYELADVGSAGPGQRKKGTRRRSRFGRGDFAL